MNATVLPTSSQLKFFYWQNKPILSRGMAASVSDTTIYWSQAPTDETGAIITGAFLVGVTNKAGKTEIIWVPAGAVAADGLSASGIVRGINPMGLDYTVGDSDFVLALDGGSKVFCTIAAQIGEMLRAVLQGLIASGAAGITIGLEAGGTVTIYRATGVGTKQGFIRWNTGNSKTEYSNDGSSWNSIDSVTASNLLVVTASDTTPSNLNAKTASGTGITRTVLNPGGNEQLEFSVNGTLANLISDVTATATEINQALDGISANVTFTNLNTLTGGGNADALHSHISPSATYMAYEAISANDAVALLPIEVEWFGQLTEVTSALGDANARRRYAMKFIPSVTSSSLTTMLIRAAEQVNASTTVGSLLISIQTDNAGAPSGTPITNGSANAITQATQRTWNTTMASRTVTWASPPTLTAGTTYWLVIECQSTDVANYLKIGNASSYDESYLTFTRLTYDVDTATWGSSTTVTPLFFWFNTQVHLLGAALCQTDANWGGRTWAFKGFAKNAISAGASDLVYYDTAPLSSLTPGSVYYLSETPGQLTTTPPASFQNGATVATKYTYRVGYADSVVFNIDRGPKVVNVVTGNLTATTTQNYIPWFRPTDIQIKGVGGVGVVAEASESFGFASDASAVYSVTHGNSGGTANSNANFFSIDSGTSDTFTGALSLLSNAGVTVTYTEAGTYGMAAILRLEG